MNAAVAYLSGLEACGLKLEVRAGLITIPPGHTEAEVELVRLLKPELVAILDAECQKPRTGDPPNSLVQRVNHDNN